MIPRLLTQADITTLYLNDFDQIFLTDGVISCVVTEERNGLYELKMVYSVNGSAFSQIELGMLILAKVSNNFFYADATASTDNQLFRIYRITKPLNGRVTIYAEHISYRASQIPVRPFTYTGNVRGLLDEARHYAMIDCPFLNYSDITLEEPLTYTVSEPTSLRSILLGEQGSILQVLGRGEYLFDNYSIRLFENRGKDRGVVLNYGVNIAGMTQDAKISETYSGICPFWKGYEQDGVTETLVMLPERIVYASNHSSFPYERVIPVNLTDKFDDKPTVEQLRNEANSYIVQNDIGTPDVTIDISFIPISQTQSTDLYQTLQRLYLCDTVTVNFPEFGIATQAKVVRTVYDCLKERQEAVTIGTIKQNFSSTVSDSLNELKEAIAKKK